MTVINVENKTIKTDIDKNRIIRLYETTKFSEI